MMTTSATPATQAQLQGQHPMARLCARTRRTRWLAAASRVPVSSTSSSKFSSSAFWDSSSSWIPIATCCTRRVTRLCQPGCVCGGTASSTTAATELRGLLITAAGCLTASWALQALTATDNQGRCGSGIHPVTLL